MMGGGRKLAAVAALYVLGAACVERPARAPIDAAAGGRDDASGAAAGAAAGGSTAGAAGAGDDASAGVGGAGGIVVVSHPPTIPPDPPGVITALCNPNDGLGHYTFLQWITAYADVLCACDTRLCADNSQTVKIVGCERFVEDNSDANSPEALAEFQRLDDCLAALPP
jgi:hypothetical protein